MERRAPLPRGKQMIRGGGLARGKPMNRARTKARSDPRKPTRSRTSSIDAEVRDLVLGRCLGMCEACGEPLAGAARTHLHHRLPRSAGGADHPTNLVALHSTCHVLGPAAVHEKPSWATSRGLIVPRGADPAATPLHLEGGALVLLTDTARYEYLPVG